MPATPTTPKPFAAFNAQELATLAKHKLAVYRDKIIVNAQPPINDIEQARVARLIGGPVPESLMGLWRVAFGGELDYDLSVALGEHIYTASFRELFYPDSDGYRDLTGWIEHELEAAQEAAQDRGVLAPTRLKYLPFGGFEYLERFYLVTHGDEQDRVLIWARGLPPAWKGRLNEDTVATAAPTLETLFDQLELSVDPRAAAPDSYPSGESIIETIDALREDNPSLAERLDALVQKSIFDWRGLVSSTPFTGESRQWQACRVALLHACEQDELELLDTLIAHAYPLDRHITGKASALSYCVSQGAKRVAQRILECGQPFGDSSIIHTKQLDLPLAKKLIDAGVGFDIAAVLSTATQGEVDTALHLVTHAKRHGQGEWEDIRKHALDRAQREDESADKIEAGKMGSYATPQEHRAMAQRLRELVRGL